METPCLSEREIALIGARDVRHLEVPCFDLRSLPPLMMIGRSRRQAEGPPCMRICVIHCYAETCGRGSASEDTLPGIMTPPPLLRQK